MRRATLVLPVALALALASAACGTEEWGFYDPPAPADAALDADVDLDVGDVVGAEANRDGREGDAVSDGDAHGQCDPEASRCPVSCAGGAPCPELEPVCTEPHDLCEPCRSNQDCDTVRAGPICANNGSCLPECDPNHPCPQSRPHCDRAIGRCVSSSTSTP